VASIVNDPLAYDGLTVEIDSQISDWVTKKSFTLGSSGGIFGGGGQQLLVVSEKSV